MKLKKIVKKFGNKGAHVTLPKRLIGREVTILFRGSFVDDAKCRMDKSFVKSVEKSHKSFLDSVEEITKRL